MIKVRITVHEAMNFKWQEEPHYQGYIPKEKTWNDIAATFVKDGYSIDNPLRLSLVKGKQTMVVDVCAFKLTGQILPLSSKTTPIESQFVLCTIRSPYNGKIAIIF